MNPNPGLRPPTREGPPPRTRVESEIWVCDKCKTKVSFDDIFPADYFTEGKYQQLCGDCANEEASK